MKITRDGNSFAIEVEHEDQAEALEDLLKKFVQPAPANPKPESKGPSTEDKRNYFLMECMKTVAASLNASVIQIASNSAFAPPSLEETARDVADAYVSGLRRFNELIETAL